MITYGNKINTENEAKNVYVIDRLQRACDSLDWTVSVYKQDEEYYFEFENYTDYGQDVVESCFVKDFEDEDGIRVALFQMYKNFDPDEEVKYYTPGENGAPDTMRELLDDMEEVKAMLKALYETYCEDRKAIFKPVHDRKGNKRYAYLLVINKAVAGTLAQDWRSDEEKMKATAGAMAITARTFKKSAGVLVYEYGINEEKEGFYHLCHSCNVGEVKNQREYYAHCGLPYRYQM